MSKLFTSNGEDAWRRRSGEHSPFAGRFGPAKRRHSSASVRVGRVLVVLATWRAGGGRYNALVAELRVLFLCIGNTCRSPMAEAIARHRGGQRVRSCSAGLAPTGRVAAETLRTLDRLGYPSDGLASKGVASIDLGRIDLAVSLVGPGGFSALPASLPVERIAWRVRDPFGEDEAVYLAVARDIEARVIGMLGDVLDPELPSL